MNVGHEPTEALRELMRQIEREAERKEHDQAIAQCVTALSVDEAGVIGRATPPLATLFGYLDGELDGMPVEQLLPERFRAAHGGQHLPGFFSRPMARPMGSGTGEPGTQRTVLAGWNQRDRREFPIVIGLEPRYYLGRKWAIATVAQPLAADSGWRELATRLAQSIGVDVTGLDAAEAERLVREALAKG